MTLIVLMVAILFSQSALAQVEFRAGEPVLSEVGEVQDQGVAAVAGLKIFPLQAFTIRISDELPWAWWLLDEEFVLRALFTVRGTGTYYTRIKVTDVKTGLFIRFPKEGPYTATGGVVNAQTSTPLSVGPLSGVPVRLPRQFILTYEFKVGTTWKGVSTKMWLY
jgi:hypothetical protein